MKTQSIQKILPAICSVSLASCLVLGSALLPVRAAEAETDAAMVQETETDAAVVQEDAPQETESDEVNTSEASEENEETDPSLNEPEITVEETAEEESAGEGLQESAASAEETKAGTSVEDYVQELSFYKDGDDAVLTIYGYRADQWSYPLQSNVNMVLTYSDGSTEKINTDYGYKELHGDSYRLLSSDLTTELHGSNYLTVTIRIPLSELRRDPGVSIQADKLSASLADAPPVEEAGSRELSPYGQNIGGVVDWSTIELTPLYSAGTNNTEPDYPPRCAWVFSENKETIYIYLENVVDWSGDHSTGNFDIITDTKRTFMLRILDGEVMVGNDNEKLSNVVHIGGKNNGSYEIPVPISMLPVYISTVSFGYDMEEPVLTGLKLTGGAAPADLGQISKDGIDGDYSEWQSYSLSRLDYTTGGTQKAVADGECALYSDGDYIMGYCESTLGAHTENALDVSTITLYNRVPENGKTDFGWNAGDLGFKYAKVDENGKMTWLSAGDLQAITSGTTELYIFALSDWGNSTNIDQLSQGDTNYGRLFVTVSEDGKKAQCEFFVDAAKFAARYGIAPEDLKVVASQYIRIGGFTSCAGTSTYPYVGAAILLGIAGAGFFLWKKKEPRDKAGAGAQKACTA